MKTEVKFKVNIEKETAKAVFVNVEGVRGWLPKAWVKGGEISEKVFAGLKEKAQEAEDQREWKNDFHKLAVVKESEKAVAVMAEAVRIDGEWEKGFMVWFSKSVCRCNDGEWKAPGWLLLKKFDEARQTVPSGFTLMCLKGTLYDEEA